MADIAPDDAFALEVAALLRAVADGDGAAVAAALEARPALRDAEGPHPLWGGRPRPLHVAVERQREDVVRLLLAAGADPNPDSSSYDGWTPLLIAARAAAPRLVALLLEAGARTDAWSAAALGDTTRLRSLLADDPTLAHARGPNRATPLHFAATVEAARLLADAGADLGARDQYGSTPVRAAAYARAVPREVGRFLLERGGEEDVFLYCALGDRAAVAARLDREPALLEARDPHLNASAGRGATPLHLAVSVGDLAMATALLERGADPNARGPEGETPLHYAAQVGDEALARLLLERGADPRLRDAAHHGRPAEWAEFFEHPDVARLLAAVS